MRYLGEWDQHEAAVLAEVPDGFARRTLLWFIRQMRAGVTK